MSLERAEECLRQLAAELADQPAAREAVERALAILAYLRLSLGHGEA